MSWKMNTKHSSLWMKEHSTWLSCFWLPNFTFRNAPPVTMYSRCVWQNWEEDKMSSWTLKRNINGLEKVMGYLWSTTFCFVCLPMQRFSFPLFMLVFPHVCWLKTKYFALHCHRLQGKVATYRSREDRRVNFLFSFNRVTQKPRKEISRW